MKHFINDYFTFSRRERNGIFLLSGIIAFLLILLTVYPYFISTEKVDFSKFKAEITAFEADTIRDEKTELKSRSTIIKESKVELFSFDPNNLSDEDGLKLGLSQKQINNIHNYISKGGKFRAKEDLLKIYSIKEKQYKILAPFIGIKEIGKPTSTFEKPLLKSKKVIELNSADSIQLVSLDGIGPAFAKRIISFRKSLGGFYSKEQLNEVYGIDSTVYLKISESLMVDQAIIKQININHCSVNDLKSHPYFKYNIANALVNYRKQHGNFSSIEDIKKIVLINNDVYQKLVPYIKTTE